MTLLSVLIKDIDRELYAKFKAAAAMRGLRLNDALCHAIKKWIEEETPKTQRDRDRLQNNATFRRLIPSLIEHNEGDWVVISEGELIGIYPDRKKAIEAVRSNNLRDSCNIVSPITKKKRKVTLGFGRKLS